MGGTIEGGEEGLMKAGLVGCPGWERERGEEEVQGVGRL